MWKTIFCNPYPEAVTVPKKISHRSFFIMHLVFAIVLVTSIIFKAIISPKEIYRYFTLWAMCITTLYSILVLISYIHGRHYHPDAYKQLQAKEHYYYNHLLCALLRMSVSIQFLVVVVFYLAIAPYSVVKYLQDPAYLKNLNKINLVFNWTTHIIPISFNIIELVYSTITFPVLQLVWPISLCLIFGIADYLFTTKANSIAYPAIFDWSSPVIIASIVLALLLAAIGYFIGYAITRSNLLIHIHETYKSAIVSTSRAHNWILNQLVQDKSENAIRPLINMMMLPKKLSMPSFEDDILKFLENRISPSNIYKYSKQLIKYANETNFKNATRISQIINSAISYYQSEHISAIIRSNLLSLVLHYANQFHEDRLSNILKFPIVVVKSMKIVKANANSHKLLSLFSVDNIVYKSNLYTYLSMLEALHTYNRGDLIDRICQLPQINDISIECLEGMLLLRRQANVRHRAMIDSLIANQIKQMPNEYLNISVLISLCNTPSKTIYTILTWKLKQVIPALCQNQIILKTKAGLLYALLKKSNFITTAATESSFMDAYKKIDTQHIKSMHLLALCLLSFELSTDKFEQKSKVLREQILKCECSDLYGIAEILSAMPPYFMRLLEHNLLCHSNDDRICRYIMKHAYRFRYMNRLLLKILQSHRNSMISKFSVSVMRNIVRCNYIFEEYMEKHLSVILSKYNTVILLLRYLYYSHTSSKWAIDAFSRIINSDRVKLSKIPFNTFMYFNIVHMPQLKNTIKSLYGHNIVELATHNLSMYLLGRAMGICFDPSVEKKWNASMSTIHLKSNQLFDFVISIYKLKVTSRIISQILFPYTVECGNQQIILLPYGSTSFDLSGCKFIFEHDLAVMLCKSKSLKYVPINISKLSELSNDNAVKVLAQCGLMGDSKEASNKLDEQDESTPLIDSVSETKLSMYRH